jgi:cob(I)alamin adenosyltransferase
MAGYIHLYTGNGKGKTTAAIGQAIRAAGAGLSVYIAQFVKGMPYSELEILQQIPNITIKQFGLDCFIVNKPTQKDIDAANEGLRQVKEIIDSASIDILILDEVCIALYYHLFPEAELLTLLRNKPQNMEIILTSRYAPASLIDSADLVTEMKEIRHYFQRGIEARKGIEY